MMNKLELLRIFCTAAQSDSFKAAAVRLGISPQAVTRAVQQLEQSTGEVLFHRSTRHIKLTRFAEEFLQQAQASLAQLDALFQKRQADREHVVAGLVRIAAPKVLRPVLMPVFTALAQRYQLDLATLLKEAGLPADLLERADSLLPLVDVMRLFVVVLARCADPGMGFEVGRLVRARSYQVLGYVILASRDIGEAIDKLLSE